MLNFNLINNSFVFDLFNKNRIYRAPGLFPLIICAAILLLSIGGAATQAATFTVTKVADTNDGACNSDCSLREAIEAANAASSSDVIVFDANVFGTTAQTITLGGSQLVIFNNGTLAINGVGASLLSVSGNNVSRILVNEGATTTITGMTITSGNGQGSNPGTGGAVFNGSGGVLTFTDSVISNSIANRAGGIYNIDGSTLILNNSTVSNNSAAFGGGGIYSSNGPLTVNNSIISGNITTGNQGGGILTSNAVANITNSTIKNNSAAGGGGIGNFGTVNLTSSTVSGNTAETGGGGIFSASNQTIVNIINSTISGNSTQGAAGGISMVAGATYNLSYSTVAYNTSDSDSNGSGNGGGINNAFGGTLNANNSIIASNIDNTGAAPDFAGSLTSQGYNLIGSVLGLTITGTTTGNILGQDARLLPLGNYGGATQTHALQPNSPAIDAANPNSFPATDQRGVARPLDGDQNGTALPDIGAYERQSAIFRVTKTSDTNDNVCDADCSLREAFAAANASASTPEKTIIFDQTLFSTPQTIALTLGELKINENIVLSISGTGAALLTVSGSNQSRILYISPGATAAISGLTMTGGNGVGTFSNSGGAIHNNRGTLTITNSVLRNNLATFSAGAVYNNSGTLNISDSTVSNNSAPNLAGGIYNSLGATMNAAATTFAANSSFNGGAIHNAGGNVTLNNSTLNGNTAGNGGGVQNFSDGTLIVNNTTFINNTASIRGGAIVSTGTLTVTDSLINSNSATGNASGGGIASDATATITESTISNNSAGFGAGGVDNLGNMTIRSVSIVGNTSITRGGGIDNSGILDVRHSTVSGNSAGQFGGGIVNTGRLFFANSTISGNSANGSDGGGGIYNASLNGDAYVINSTVAKNKADFVSANGGGGGIRNTSTTLFAVRNSIIADNTSSGGNVSAPDFFGTLFSQGYNLIENPGGANITGNQTGNILGQDPRLLPLRNNGGLTKTHGLKLTSPALDQGNNFGDILDQRFRPRVYNHPNIPNAFNGTDIGAFESQPDDVTSATNFDYDGDSRADVSVFRPSDGTWYLNRSTLGFAATQFGASNDQLAPADYDGDGRTDLGVYRNDTWYLLRSTAGFTAIQFGAAGDIPQPADFDGDGRAELAIFRPSDGTWYVLNLANGQFNGVQFGANGDKPVVADYDGDAKADYAVFRPSNGTWYMLRSQSGFAGVQFGISTDKPVVGDYDGDGKADPAVYRDGVWYLLRSQQGFGAVQFGVAADLPAPADYDGDDKTDLAVYRNNTWYLLLSTQGFAGVQFGAAGDIPTPNAFVR